ncbi:hypothetical protein ccbrp13_20690 [Ktedonobacteria bacterium brp13]|nr:hypothetical protein ccbrp13_20690 [Ktedonobacteria bacterium brp13]
MNETSRQILELFVEKAEELLQYSATVNKLGGLFSIYADAGKENWQLYPEVKGFVVTFRRFIQQEKHFDISLYPFRRDGSIQRPKLLDLTDVSEHWKEAANHAWEAGYQFLTLPLPDINQPTTRQKVLEVFIYGDMLHSTQYQQYKEWKSNPELYGKLCRHFDDGLAFTFLKYILPLAEASTRELQRH